MCVVVQPDDRADRLRRVNIRSPSSVAAFKAQTALVAEDWVMTQPSSSTLIEGNLCGVQAAHMCADRPNLAI